MSQAESTPLRSILTSRYSSPGTTPFSRSKRCLMSRAATRRSSSVWPLTFHMTMCLTITGPSGRVYGQVKAACFEQRFSGTEGGLLDALDREFFCIHPGLPLPLWRGGKRPNKRFAQCLDPDSRFTENGIKTSKRKYLCHLKEQSSG